MKVSQNIIKDYARTCRELEKAQKKISELESERKALKEENRDLRKNLKEQERLNKRQAVKIDSLKKQHEEDVKQRKENAQEIKGLKEKLARLTAFLNLNSDNSSLSTGTDQNRPRKEKKPKSANEYNGRKKGVNPKGGQKGHKGKSLSKAGLKALLEKDNVILEIKDEGDPALPYFSEYYLDFILTVKVVEQRIHTDSPKKIRAHRGSIFYGSTLKALCVLLNINFDISYHKISDFVETLTHGAIRPSSASVYKFCRDFAGVSKEKAKKVAKDLLKQPVVGTDSTVMIAGGERNYIRVFTTPKKTLYQALRTKTIEEIEKVTLLPYFDGILVHDHETSMFHYGSDNAKCLVHEIRYCRKHQDQTGNPWCFEMESFFQKLLSDRKEAISQGKMSFSQEEIRDYHEEYRKILKKGFEQNKTTEFEFARKEEKAFLNRLKSYEHNVLLFLTDFSIPPDNNRCEARLRGCKTKQKVTGGFKTFQGLQDYAVMRTVLKNYELEHSDILDSIEKDFE